jgi:Predicted phosphatase/phosphohexomutase
MAHGARLDSVVMFVHDLDRSVSFYSDVLNLHVADRSATAALLIGAKRSQLILRAWAAAPSTRWAASGSSTSSGPRTTPMTWPGARRLKDRSAWRDSRTTEHVTAVEGRDPDDIVVMITYPGPTRRRCTSSRYGSTGGERRVGLPDQIRGCLFDLDGVLTMTAKVHAAAWQEMFDGYLRERSARSGEPYVPFDPVREYGEYVDGKPREDGTRSFLQSRGITLPTASPATRRAARPSPA